MKNVLLCLCRKMHCLTKKQIALKIGMTSKEYKQLEKGGLLMTRKQAHRLSDAYNIGPKYFLKSSRQLDLLLTRAEVIKVLNLQKRLYEIIMDEKTGSIQNSMTKNETEAKDKNVSHDQKTTRQ